MDFLRSGGIRDVTLRGSTHVDLVDFCQKLLGLWRMCGGRVISHAVQPAVPEKHNPISSVIQLIKYLFSISTGYPTQQSIQRTEEISSYCTAAMDTRK